MSIVSLKLDLGTVQSIALFVVKGLEPGSFGRALLRGDSKDAYRCAHALLTQGRHGDIVANMLAWAEHHVPTGYFDTDEKIAAWRGLENLGDDVRLLFYMRSTIWERYKDYILHEMRKKKAEDEEAIRQSGKALQYKSSQVIIMNAAMIPPTRRTIEEYLVKNLVAEGTIMVREK